MARAGIKAVVFERAPTPGGMLGTAIPRYRLPYETVKEDIDDILALGVELRTGWHIGRDLTLNDLRADGFDAILLATGLSESRTLGVPDIDARGVLLAMPLLRAIAAGSPPALGRRVIVIGGGNVALDVARSVRRLGAEEVTAVCLESRAEMPAWEWEVEEALAEGIRLMPSWGPRAVFTEEGEVRGIELKRCRRVFDESGRFSPQFDEADVCTRVADTVVLAIGQRADLACLEGSDVKTEGPDRLQYSQETLTTSAPDVFACGEVVTGPGAAVEAVADGHRAARSMAHYLEHGQPLAQPTDELPTIGELPERIAEKVRLAPRVQVPLAAAERRVQDFGEIERAFTEPEALAEAQRCLACTSGAFADEERCAACLMCVRICPFGVATVERTAVMPQEECQACGLCAAECPAAAIALTRFGTNQMKAQLQQLLASAPEGAPAPIIVSYCCLFETTSSQFLRPFGRLRTADGAAPSGAEGQSERADAIPSDVLPVMVPCVARLSIADLLAPFEHGAEAVVVISCSDGECLYPTAEDRLAMRVRRVKQILEEIGLGAERLDHWKTQESAEVSWGAFWQISRRKLQAVQESKPEVVSP